MKTFYQQNAYPEMKKKPGQSLRQLQEDKSIILYVLNKIKTCSSREQLSDIILRNIQFNYFDLQTYLDELIQDHYIMEFHNNNGRKELMLSKEGKNTIETISYTIPAYMRELIDLYIEKNQNKIKNRIKVKADYHTVESGNHVASLSLEENDMLLIDLKINAPTADDAVSLCKKWKKDYQPIYAKIIQCFNE